MSYPGESNDPVNGPSKSNAQQQQRKKLQQWDGTAGAGKHLPWKPNAVQRKTTLVFGQGENAIILHQDCRPEDEKDEKSFELVVSANTCPALECR